jgi:pimeloyl-ACP methyl ester carboxylesterase
MSTRGRILGAAAGAVGLAAAGAALGIRRQSRAIEQRTGDGTPFGSLHSAPMTVVADDGVPLHVEVDELDPDLRRPSSPLTLVFCHGYALNLECWHFQRAAYRGLVRSVYYDQRSHGRSGRSPEDHATIEQLGHDLRTVLEQVVPEGPVVLVGHSMGGMSIVALAEAHPELIGDRIVGVGLISTTAGGLDAGRILLPMLPAKLGGELTSRTVRTLARRHKLVDGVRRAGKSVATVATDLFAFGDEVPAAYVEFVDRMLSDTPFEVVADFFPSLHGLDKFDAVEVLGQVPTTIICGTADRLTSIGHSRKLHERIPGSTLIECEDAGHMVLLERHDQVNAAIDQLLSAATEQVGQR